MIADDHQLFAEGLRDALDSLPDIRVVGVVGDGASLLEKLATQPAEVALVDLEMPGMGGLETIRKLPPRTPALVVTMHVTEETRERARAVGAAGFFSKSASLVKVAAAIRATAAGKKLIDLQGDALETLLAANERPQLDERARSLTDREIEVLRLLATGVSSTEELADLLYISQKTVKNHLASIFNKLAVADRTQAAIEAIRLGLAKPK
jgi:DNA-binding NarL/FixJ family response regulator